MAASGVGSMIEEATGQLGTGDHCADLAAAWLAQGKDSGPNWHRAFNAWAAELGCPLPNPSAGTGRLSANDRADIAAMRALRPGTVPSIPPAPPKGGPPIGLGPPAPVYVQPPNDIIVDDFTRSVPSTPPQTPDDRAFLGGLVGWIGGAVGWIKDKIPTGNSICGFARDIRRMRLEASTKEDWTWIGYSADLGCFVYSKTGRDGPWFVPYCRIGQDQLAGDRELPPGTTITERQAVQGTPGTGGAPGTQPGTQPGTTGVPGLPINRLLGIEGVQPTIVMRRTCPPLGGPGGVRMRLATDGMCYPREFLPERLWANKKERGVFTARDKKTLQKARAVRRRLDTLAENYGDMVHHHREREHTHEHRHHRHKEK